MDASRTPPLPHDELNALVDGQLTAGQRAAAMARVADDPLVGETLKAWQDQREALRGLHQKLLDEPIPETLLATVQRSTRERQALDPWWRWGGMAAGVLLAFAVGWTAHGQLGSKASYAAGHAARASQAFAHQATLAHAVFAPEVRHPVEVGAAQQDHLVQWLSRRLGKPVKVPLLSSQGYELVGGRLLPGDDGARAQFMFQNAAGVRVTLYLGALEGSPAAGKPVSAETAFRYSSDGPVPAFYWTDQGFGYAMSGPVAREELMRLAELVYQQL
ncbi:anti-sigma factor [Polaromonas sp.]|uniref:anti-sigma factor family protein n=1 Tax=Polaromonas sp. TaxID=1869339 RepID=UPI00248A89EF|nr:anti-sigma factor [Polaromonas sp.]MDI1273966.1 anti-sigma factor [Polaromonas sp.]MDI1275498.1 anti-sigma factor [Polaromonas sp.]